MANIKQSMMEGTSMAKRKALMIYSSMTGNTKMIAEAFGEVCEENGFAVDYLKIAPGIDWDEHPVYVEEYDLVGLGSPIIAGLPELDITDEILSGLNAEYVKEKDKK